MKMTNKLALILTAAALVATPAVAKNASSKTVDTLQFSIRTTLADTGVEPGSSGTVSGSEVRQKGVVNSQKLDVSVSGLTPDTAYSLVATTAGGPVDLADFNTDANGNASVHLFAGKGKGAKNTVPFPDGFEFAQTTQLDVNNSGGVSVLSTADTTPTSVKYVVKRTLTGDNGETGTLQINASTKKTKFTLKVTGLQPSTDYDLVLNGGNPQTFTSDSKGKLNIKAASTPTNILDLSTVELQQGGVDVLSTTLP
jgi:hypothetical protein